MPEDWEQIAREVKDAADWRCQECGKQCWRPGEQHLDRSATLTVARLNHDPTDCRPENLRALCASCHLKRNKDWNTKRASATRVRKQEKLGQQVMALDRED